MRLVDQTLEEILASLQPLSVAWADATALSVMEKLRALPMKPEYTRDDVVALLDEDFKEGLLICRLFLAMSDDFFDGALRSVREGKGAGVKGYRADRAAFVDDLDRLGLRAAMAEAVNAPLHWTDALVERLRAGRGSAVSGQKLGRDVEDFVETIVKAVFGGSYDTRCTFSGRKGEPAKCDFAIPSREAPRIVIEAKGYAATGSKMTDVLGDLRTIINAKRPDTALLFFTDGITWRRRANDLRKIVEHQNNGDIARIYTRAMAAQFEADLQRLKLENGL